MSMKLGYDLTIEQAQKLVMTPELIQAIQILQFNTQELDAYVEEQLAVKKFWRLRGLLYFTDGYGVFPVKMPPYETAFIFVQNHYRDVDVPAWAIKLILQESDLENKEFQRRRK